MSKQIQEFVAENSESASRINSTLIEINNRRRRNFTFAQNIFVFDVKVEVEQRELNDTLISGHPAEKHGSGRGKGGDRRSRWNEKDVDTTTSDFVPTGRNLVTQALNGGGVQNKMRFLFVGRDDGIELPRFVGGNTSSDSLLGFSAGWTNPANESNASNFTAQLLFPTVGRPDECGVYALNAAMYGRVGFEPFDSPEEEELRFQFTLSVEGETPGDSVITDEGERIVAKSIRTTNTPIGLQTVLFGSGDTDPDESDTALDTPEFEEIGERETAGEGISVRAVIPETEPNDQPTRIRELGIATNDDVLVWRVTPDSINKTDQLSLTSRVNFQIR